MAPTGGKIAPTSFSKREYASGTHQPPFPDSIQTGPNTLRLASGSHCHKVWVFFKSCFCAGSLDERVCTKTLQKSFLSLL